METALGLSQRQLLYARETVACNWVLWITGLAPTAPPPVPSLVFHNVTSRTSGRVPIQQLAVISRRTQVESGLSNQYPVLSRRSIGRAGAKQYPPTFAELPL